MDFKMTNSSFEARRGDMYQMLSANGLAQTASAVSRASVDGRIVTIVRPEDELRACLGRAVDVGEYLRDDVRLEGVRASGYLFTGMVLEAREDGSVVTIDSGMYSPELRDPIVLHPAAVFSEDMSNGAYPELTFGDFVQVTNDMPHGTVGLRARAESWDRCPPVLGEDRRDEHTGDFNAEETLKTVLRMPGLYNSGFRRTGVVTHVNEQYVYQDLGRGQVAEHERKYLFTVPKEGANVRVDYNQWPCAKVTDLLIERLDRERRERSEMSGR